MAYITIGSLLWSCRFSRIAVFRFSSGAVVFAKIQICIISSLYVSTLNSSLLKDLSIICTFRLVAVKAKKVRPEILSRDLSELWPEWLALMTLIIGKRRNKNADFDSNTHMFLNYVVGNVYYKNYSSPQSECFNNSQLKQVCFSWFVVHGIEWRCSDMIDLTVLTTITAQWNIHNGDHYQRLLHYKYHIRKSVHSSIPIFSFCNNFGENSIFLLCDDLQSITTDCWLDCNQWRKTHI